MAHHFGSLVFTAAVKALQESHGSRRQYEKWEADGSPTDRLGPEDFKFIEARDSFYMATIGSSGWPYIQHRGGPKGFLKVLDNQTIAFADFRGNRQYISTGNLLTDNRVALIMVDYPSRSRLKILGRAEIFEAELAKEWINRVVVPEYKATVERVYVIRVEGFDWNCPQHITPRYTAEEIRAALDPIEARMQKLETENGKLRQELAHTNGN
jgi:predicted pyridoxine 5'-phosphate oxidase superfamily flavin-nucleotide-binding protein